MFWTDLFANLWQHAELPNSKSDALKHGYLGPMPSTVLPCPVFFYGRHLPWPCTTEKTGRDATRLKPKFALLYVFRAEIEIIVWLLRVFLLFPWRSWALETLFWPLPGLVYSIWNIQWSSRNIILVKYATLNCAECLQDQATASSSVYCHISFSPCNKNLEKFIFVKSTSIQKNQRKK